MALINITFGEKNKTNKTKTDKPNKPRKKKKTPLQHTKVIINFVLFMSFLMCLAVVVVGIVTNTPINDVTIEWIKCVAIVLSSGMLKSYFESKQEKLAKLEYLKAGLKDEYERNEDI